jgi:fumarate reductase flavoprotein subunit
MFRAHDQYAVQRAWVGADQGLAVLETLRPVWDRLVAEGAITVLFETAMTELLVDGDSVVGVRAEGAEGPLDLRAPATVLTTGGYGYNPDFHSRVTPGSPRLVSGARESSTGDGIIAAMRVSARFRGGEHGYPTVGPLELVPGRADSWIASASLVPFDRPPREIHVNVRGERFVAEDEPSADARQEAAMRQPDQQLWIVFDDAAIEAGDPLVRRMSHDGDPNVPLLERRWSTPEGLRERAGEGVCVWKGDTLRELAGRTGIDPDSLERTVAAWNEAVRTGDDPLGRRTLDHPIERPPFYAVVCHGTTQLTYGGLAVDGGLRVLDERGEPIAGLYAAGEALGAAALMGDTICGGIMVTSCLSFGRILGRKLAPAPVPQPA